MNYGSAVADELCIIIPAFNEQASIVDTISEYRHAFPGARIVVIDNASTDETARLARDLLDPDHDLLLFEPKSGKGFAIKRGLSRVSADIYLMVDGDGTYPAEDARQLFSKFMAVRPDMIVGDRVSGGAYDQQNDRVGHALGNRLLTRIISELSGQRYLDVLSGLRILSRPFVSSLDVRSSGFQLETEINVIAARLRADVIEMPISYRARKEGSQSKLNTISDGVRILLFAINNWIAFLPMQAFTLVAVMAFAIAGFLGFRVISAFVDSGFAEMPYPSSAVGAAAAGLVGVQALFSGISLRLMVRNDRRRDIADFLEAKRRWNAKLDELTGCTAQPNDPQA